MAGRKIVGVEGVCNCEAYDCNGQCCNGKCSCAIPVEIWMINDHDERLRRVKQLMGEDDAAR